MFLFCYIYSKGAVSAFILCGISDNHGWWDVSFLSQFFTVAQVRCSPAIFGSYLGAGSDIAVWKWKYSGVYSTKSAYQILQHPYLTKMFGRLAWSFDGPQRVCHFIWLVLCNGLLMGTPSGVCGHVVGDITHVLRDCTLISTKYIVVSVVTASGR
ncbi:hypothetical protein V6N13_048986 [Hibiscus sabdariffa]|uniref:Reverse transcriptase zinc-binding domain-containing protein n=1 Tax=Hibiscus sabdariffa TaxID=183260 RepID=A0ABR2QYG6_9ROSI